MNLDKLSKEEKIQLYELLRAKEKLKCKSSYIDYVEYVHEGRWKRSKHLDFLCSEVQNFIESNTGNAYDILVISCPPQHGKCLVSGSRVSMSDGSFKPIEEVAPHNMVESLDESCYNIVESKVLNNFYNGVKPVLKIKLTSGREIVCTENHPLLTVNGWTNAELLRVGDRLAASKKTKFPDSENLPRGYSKIMGYLIGDGGMTNESLCFTNNDIDIINDLRVCMEQNGWKLKKINGHKYGYRLTSDRHNRGDFTPRSVFKPLMGEENAHNKRIPDIIFKANKKDASDFIGAYFDCDGTVTGYREGVAEFYSVSEQLLKDTQIILNRFAIYSKLRIKKGKYKGEDHYSYRLIINGQDLITFYNEINIVGEKKKKLAEIVNKIKDKKFYPEYNAIHKDWKKYLKNSSRYFRANGIRIDKKYTVGTDKGVVLKCAELEENEYLKKICSNEIIWDEIISINKIGDFPTYDIEVENTHNFIVEGVFVHNSQSITETLPSWYMGKNPMKRVILASYNEDTAERFCRRNKEKIRTYGKELFGIEIGSIDRSIEFELTNGVGRMISRGIMGGITGAAGDLIILDDPLKNRQEADSETHRERLWEEWQNTIKTRLSAGAKVIVIATRWHEDDVSGRILDNEKNVKIINLPCEAEENDVLGRPIGQALFPEIGKDDNWLKDFKQGYVKGEGSRAWLALFQGRPVSESGNLVQRTWWKYYTELPPIQIWLMSVDAAFKDGEDSDYTAIQIWGKNGPNMYLIESINEKLNFPNTLRRILELKAKYPQVGQILVEDKANGSAIIQTLRMKIGGIIAVEPHGGKVSRVNAIAHFIEAGNVWLPKDDTRTTEFVNQFSSFPHGKNDDICDCASQALSRFAFYHTEEIESPKKYAFNFEKPKEDNLLGGIVDVSYINY